MSSAAVSSGSGLSAVDWALDYAFGPTYWDSRTQHWPLVSGRAAIMIVAFYLAGVPLARSVMAERKAIDVRKFVTWHNVGMMLLSLWMCVESVREHYYCAGWDQKFTGIWGATAQQGKTFTPHCRRLAIVLYVHYLSKVAEFTDTFIMILKHNDRQITFLHIYHHASTFFCWWVSMNFAPGGDAYFVCALNSFVHVIMYSYYLVSAAKIIKIPVVVKKSITSMQMVQFALFISQVAWVAVYRPNYRPKISMILSAFQGGVFITLFGNFFLKTYLSKGKKAQTARAAAKQA